MNIAAGHDSGPSEAVAHPDAEGPRRCKTAVHRKSGGRAADQSIGDGPLVGDVADEQRRVPMTVLVREAKKGVELRITRLRHRVLVVRSEIDKRHIVHLAAQRDFADAGITTEDQRVGKRWVSTCIYRW